MAQPPPPLGDPEHARIPCRAADGVPVTPVSVAKRLDTSYLHIVAWWEAFGERGHDVLCSDIHRAIGMSSAELVERVIGKPDPSVSEAHSRRFAPYLGRMRPLPKAAQLLAATARLGLHVVLATSAKDDEVGLMLDALGAGDR